MSMGPDVIALLEQLHATGELDGVNSVIEFGDQEVRLLHHGPVLRSLLTEFGKADLVDTPRFDDLCHCQARALYEAIGWSCVSLDTNTKLGARYFDMNVDQVPEAERGTYDLCTNIGTSEHVFNQYNVFKSVHEFTRPGGLMLHYLPFLGYVDHGYYSFQPCIFLDLAAANDYEIIGAWINPYLRKFYLVPWSPEVLDDFSMQATESSAILFVLRKKSDAPFEVPFQGRYAEMVSKEGFQSKYRLIADGTRKGLASQDRLLENAPIRKLVHTIWYRFLRKARRTVRL